ncbi:MAG: c-type cytochrome [Phenylobacterium sp.]
MALPSIALGLIVLASACAGGRNGAPDVAFDPAVLRGRDFVSHRCRGCHAVNPSGASTYAAAPPFRTLGQVHTPETLRLTVADISRAGHHGMPQTIITPSEAADIMAFMRALDDPDPARLRRLNVTPCVSTARC